jgi:hypothetical protein
LRAPFTGAWPCRCACSPKVGARDTTDGHLGAYVTDVVESLGPMLAGDCCDAHHMIV